MAEPARNAQSPVAPPVCPTEDQLEAYFAGTDGAEAHAAIRDHCRSCDRCGAWLAEASADEQILGDVRQVLGNHVAGGRGSSDFRSDRNRQVAIPAVADRPPELAGFRVIRKLGEGGMGVVYEAEQERPRRGVALKVVRAGRRLSLTHQRLFQREADALARLRHANIAAIYQAGCTDDGDPYFAMELVGGRPLGEYVAAARPTLDEKLRLFCRIADAIHYAHQRGVVHRDLKPGNVLVSDETASAIPKILDFGLARVAEDELGAAPTQSDAGRIQGTLAYMSPEQARGESAEIDARSDVYSLGVMLYELLTGAQPYITSRRPLHEAVRAICDEPPRRPSQFAPSLRGDLDAIVLKTLEKDPARRYASAAALSDDLQRFLTDQPVEARRPTLAYQLRKLVLRHRAGAALTGILVLTVIGFSAAMTALYFQSNELRVAAEKNAEAAQRESEKLAAITSFLENMLASANPSKAPQPDLSVRETLDRAVAQLDRGELAQQDAVQGALRTTIGRAYLSLSVLPAAREQFERALALHELAFGPDSEAAAASCGDLAKCLMQTGDIETAEGLARRALDSTRRRHPGGHADVLAAEVRLAQLLEMRGDAETAETMLREALAGFRQIYSSDHRDIAATLYALGRLLSARSRFEEAETLLREALAMHETLTGPSHPDVATTLQALGSVLQRVSRWDEAAEVEARVLELARQFYREPHAVTAVALNNLGTIAFARGRFADAERHLREAIEMQTIVFGEKHTTTTRAINNLGDALRELSRFDEAETQIRRALDLRTELLGDDHIDIASSLTSYGMLMRKRGKLEDALSMHERAYEIRRTALGENSKEALESLGNTAAVLRYQRKNPEAEAIFRQVLAGQRETLGNWHSQVALTLTNLSDTLVAQQKLDEAASLLDEALAIRRAVLGDGSAGVADTLTIKGRLLSQRGNHAGGLPLLEEALRIRKALREPSAATAVSYNNIGFVLKALGRLDEAETNYRKALDDYRAIYGEKHPEIGTTTYNLGELYRQRGDVAAALAHYESAYEMWRETRGPEDRMTLDAIRRLVEMHEAAGNSEKVAEYRALLPAAR